MTSDVGASPPVINSVDLAFKADSDPTEPVPTGTVVFSVNGVNAGFATLDNTGLAETTWSPTFKDTGTYTVTAFYSGDFYYILPW